MKKFIALVCILCTVFLASCGKPQNTDVAENKNVSSDIAPPEPEEIISDPSPDNATGSEFVDLEKAKAIALEKAGLSESDVTFIKAEPEREDGRMVYEIEFRHGNTEYEAEISANDGAILSWDTDKDD